MNREFERRWKARFESYAEKSDDEAAIAGWSATGLQARLRYFGQLWRGGRGAVRYLDAGCGAGTYCRYLIAQGVDTVGIDYSLPTVIKARRHSEGEGAWIAGDAAGLPVRSASFDGAICFGVTQAVGETEPLVAELARVVREDGEIWVDGLNRWCLPHIFAALWRRIRGLGMHLRYESPWHVARLLKKNGLRGVRVYWLPIAPARWMWLQAILESGPCRIVLRLCPPVGACVSHAFVVKGRKRTAER